MSCWDACQCHVLASQAASTAANLATCSLVPSLPTLSTCLTSANPVNLLHHPEIHCCAVQNNPAGAEAPQVASYVAASHPQLPDALQTRPRKRRKHLPPHLLHAAPRRAPAQLPSSPNPTRTPTHLHRTSNPQLHQLHQLHRHWGTCLSETTQATRRSCLRMQKQPRVTSTTLKPHFLHSAAASASRPQSCRSARSLRRSGRGRHSTPLPHLNSRKGGRKGAPRAHRKERASPHLSSRKGGPRAHLYLLAARSHCTTLVLHRLCAQSATVSRERAALRSANAAVQSALQSVCAWTRVRCVDGICDVLQAASAVGSPRMQLPCATLS